jgi:hypothetical protein
MMHVEFYPMSEVPECEENDPSFSKTVIIYGDKKDFIEFGYYDFEIKQWAHFGENISLLKCWCYIPDPDVLKKDTKWNAIKPKGYKSVFF